MRGTRIGPRTKENTAWGPDPGCRAQFRAHTQYFVTLNKSGHRIHAHTRIHGAPPPNLWYPSPKPVVPLPKSFPKHWYPLPPQICGGVHFVGVDVFSKRAPQMYPPWTFRLEGSIWSVQSLSIGSHVGCCAQGFSQFNRLLVTALGASGNLLVTAC